MTYQSLWDAAKVVLRGAFISNPGLTQDKKNLKTGQGMALVLLIFDLRK